MPGRRPPILALGPVGPMVERLTRWTLNPGIAVQIRVGPFIFPRPALSSNGILAIACATCDICRDGTVWESVRSSGDPRSRHGLATCPGFYQFVNWNGDHAKRNTSCLSYRGRVARVCGKNHSDLKRLENPEMWMDESNRVTF